MTLRFYKLLIFNIQLFTMLIAANSSSAHEGGHYTEKDVLNIWNLKNGSAVKGNFLLAKSDSLLLEQAYGKTFWVAIKDLQTADMQLAQYKIKKMNNASHDFSGVASQQTLFDKTFAHFSSTVQTKSDNQWYYVASNGIPEHQMMVGIKRWQQQVPIPQRYFESNAWMIPLYPSFADQPISTANNFMRGAIAIAANGVPIFNALNNRGEDALVIGELDNWGGHCGRADDYHYHTAPLHLSSKTGLDPIAIALDGFAVYGNVEPDGTPMKSLDNCHGHLLDNQLYHYHGTNSYPYMIAALKGKVAIDAEKAAPENQISPQPRANPIRPAEKQLAGATIVDFTTNNLHESILTYKVGGQESSIQYKPSGSGYEFIFSNKDGEVKKEIYEKNMGGPKKKPLASVQSNASDMHFTSPAFVNNGLLPKLYTCDSASNAPPLNWANEPTGTGSFAITMHHIAKDGKKQVYMVLYDIPATQHAFSDSQKYIGIWGSNTHSKELGYAPPCSKGPGPKAYIITLYAIAQKDNFTLKPGLAMDDFLTLVKDQIIATSTISVTYSR